MNTQSKIEPSIIGALSAALAELEGAKRVANNPHFKSKYADMASVIAALEPIKAHGLWFRQITHENLEGVMVETLYIHSSGQEASAGLLFVPANKKDAQGFGSALTYARRYALQCAFGLASEDDDGNAAVKSMAGGHSQGTAQGAVSPRQKLAGPYTSQTTLKTAIKAFVSDLNGCGDYDMLTGLLHEADTQALIAQTKRDTPDWWDGGPSMPEEFVPLRRQIELAEASLAQQTANHLADIARS